MSPSIAAVLEPQQRDLGGLAVRRLLPSLPVPMIGPFIFFDHFGPAAFAPGTGMDVRPHPHIGLATLTFLLEGVIRHRDSVGSVQDIRPGDVNWMTAGRGIVHSERTPPEARAAGSALHGLQTWVALPMADEESEPSFQHHPAATLPCIELPGVRIRVIAGSAYGAGSSVPVRWPTLYAAAELAPGASFALPPEHEQRGVYALDSGLRIDGAVVPPQRLAVLASGATATISAGANAHVVLLGGAPMDGPRHIWWNFVASSAQRIGRARDDWRAGRYAPVPGETERIPLPR